MSDIDPLTRRLPRLGQLIRRESLAVLPTPVTEMRFDLASRPQTVFIKHDDLTGDLYGGNKVRKLEYLLRRAGEKKRRRIATFGAVGSHHALATAIYSRKLGFKCTCFLSHQKKLPSIPLALNMHLQNQTEIVRYGGNYSSRIAILRKHLWQRDAAVVPAGGSSWLGAIGFVNAALELAEQVNAGELPAPDRVYVAAGTLGTVVGLALGFALAGMPTVIQAIRVTEPGYSGEVILRRLIGKTVLMMRRLDRSVPADLAERANIRLRHSFFAGGYAQSDDTTDDAVRFAGNRLGLELEPTYTGKTMAALLADLEPTGKKPDNILFWNTYSSAALPVGADAPKGDSALPAEFLSYYS